MQSIDRSLDTSVKQLEQTLNGLRVFQQQLNSSRYNNETINFTKNWVNTSFMQLKNNLNLILDEYSNKISNNVIKNKNPTFQEQFRNTPYLRCEVPNKITDIRSVARQMGVNKQYRDMVLNCTTEINFTGETINTDWLSKFPKLKKIGGMISLDLSPQEKKEIIANGNRGITMKGQAKQKINDKLEFLKQYEIENIVFFVPDSPLPYLSSYEDEGMYNINLLFEIPESYYEETKQYFENSIYITISEFLSSYLNTEKGENVKSFKLLTDYPSHGSGRSPDSIYDKHLLLEAHFDADRREIDITGGDIQIDIRYLILGLIIGNKWKTIIMHTYPLSQYGHYETFILNFQDEFQTQPFRNKEDPPIIIIKQEISEESERSQPNPQVPIAGTEGMTNEVRAKLDDLNGLIVVQ